MKKLIKILASALILISVAACSKDTTADLSDGDSVLFTVGDNQVTKSEIYNTMKKQNISALVYENINNEIYDAKVTLTDDQIQAAEDQFADEKLMYGDSFEQTVQYYGYSDIDDYYDRVILANEKQKVLVSDYIDSNLETYQEKYDPKTAIILSYTEKENAQAALDMLKDGTSLSDMQSETNYLGSLEPTLITKVSTDVSTSVLTAIENIKQPEIFANVIEDSTNNTFYVLKVVSTDFEDVKDLLVTNLQSNSDELSNIIESYIDEMGLDIYDQDLYDSFATSYSNLVESN